MLRYAVTPIEADSGRGVVTLNDDRTNFVLSTSEYSVRLFGDPPKGTLFITIAERSRKTPTSPWEATPVDSIASIAANIASHVKTHYPFAERIEAIQVIAQSIVWDEDNSKQVATRINVSFPDVRDYKFNGA